jgi:hypothetical protein
VLQGRLILPVAAAVAIVTAGCAGIDGTDRGAIRENVIEPGITAMNQSSELACGGDAATLRTAMDAYELLEGSPAPDEAALVAQQFIREPSDLWDVTDGVLVPVDPACGSVAEVSPTTLDIVTSTEPPETADQVYAGFSAEQIAGVGGEACARELAAIFAAGEQHVAEFGDDPRDLQQLVDEGSLDRMPALWQITDGVLTPTADSECISLG